MKQYLMMCDENGMKTMMQLFRPESMQYLEVQGMSVQTGNVNLLVTPVLPPVTPMAALPMATEQPPTDEPVVA